MYENIKIEGDHLLLITNIKEVFKQYRRWNQYAYCFIFKGHPHSDLRLFKTHKHGLPWNRLCQLRWYRVSDELKSINGRDRVRWELGTVSDMAKSFELLNIVHG